jgi:murein DD-endopeptidase MepM/ murein hydrolase activator NlpD
VTLVVALGLLLPLSSPALGPDAGQRHALRGPRALVPGATVATVQGAVSMALALRELADELRPPSYRLPVEAAVVRPFEPPSTAYGPGHRGVDLDALPGATVRAAERGRVRHAGQVAGVVWVSIDHPDGVRTSYGPLTGLRVTAGDDVERGQVIGSVAVGDHGDPEHDRGLHLGARRDGGYIDPMGLPGIGAPRPTLVGEGGWWAADHAVTPYAAWRGGRLAGTLTASSSTAVTPGFAVPPNANHLVLVAGLSSMSGVELIDPEHLGIGADSMTHFSYAGPGLEYRVEDTWRGVEEGARRLAQQLREQASRQPGRAVDLVGHSLGGVVIAHYLLHLHDPFDLALPPIGHVVTIASPLEGSDLARAGVALVDAPGAGPALRSLWAMAGEVPGPIGETARSLEPDAQSLRDVATASAVLEGISQGWTDALVTVDAGPLATGTRILNIVASLDGLVGADRAALDGAERLVLPGTHESVLATEAVREVVWRFLAGREIVASPGRLTTHVGAWYGIGLSAVSVLAGDLAAAQELPFPLIP